MKISSIVKSIVFVAGTVYVAHLFDGGTCSCGTMGTPVAAQEASATVATDAPEGASTAPSTPDAVQASPAPAGETGSGTSVQAAPTPAPRPKMVDLGAGKCIPCKKMAPILEEAKKLYEGKADIEFIDVWENKSAGEPYGIRMIPTQIFFDAAGKEVFRHEGFFPMEDIQKQFESMGVVLKKE